MNFSRSFIVLQVDMLVSAQSRIIIVDMLVSTWFGIRLEYTGIQN